MKITLAVENAKKEVKERIEEIRIKYAIPACITEGILQDVISDLKSESAEQLIREMNEIVAEKNEEIEKAKAVAKKVLRTEQEEQKEE